MWVQPPFCNSASVRSNSAFVYCGSASMMSPQISETGLLRPCQRPGGPGSGVGAAQPLQLCVMALCTPKLMRFTPACTEPKQCFLGVTTSGLASSVISAPGRGRQP